MWNVMRSIVFRSMKLGIGLLGLASSAALLTAESQVLSPPPVILTPINTNPLKPQVTGPATIGVIPAQTTNVNLTWYQPVLSATNQNARPANYFVVCLLDISPNACSYGANTPGVWSGPAIGSIFTRTPVSSSSPFTTTPPILRGYNYTLHVTLDASYYNRWFSLYVKACAMASDAACTVSETLHTGFSSVDLVAENTGSIPNSTSEQHYFATVKNQGVTDSALVRTVLQVHQAVLTQFGPGYPWVCQTDANAAGLTLTDDDELYSADGRVVYVGARRTSAGTIDTSGLTIVGIHRSGDPTYAIGNSYASIPANRSVGVTAIDVPITRPMGFAVWMTVDDPQSIPEVDRANNRRADCDVVQ